jgi:CPA1 family monovalent cation:H+ antiporter
MTGAIVFVLALLLAIAGLALLARKVEVPYPILLVIGGLGLSFIPHLPAVHLEPDLIFVLFLPPLLYPAAIFTPWRDFQDNLRPILFLAIGLVLFTTAIVAWFAHKYFGFPLAAGFVLGAIIAPPDAVAATAIIRNLRVPRRIVAILEGESLANDATAFTTYQFAVAAIVTGTFSMAKAGASFVFAVVAGIAAGLAVGWLAALIQRRLDDPPVQTTLSLLTPYVTYLLADAIGGSGILAVVVAGVYLGWRSPEVLTPRMRLVAQSVWGMIVFILNGFIFIVIGLQLPEVIHNLSGHSPREAIWFAVLVVALTIGLRFLWFFLVTYIPRSINNAVRRKYGRPSWQNLALMSWCGMRGVDSLAAALALPLAAGGGAPFPERGLIVFLTFCVILATLVLQGLTLPFVIRWLHIAEDHSLEEEERRARLAANRSALARIARIAEARKVDQEVFGRLRTEYEDRLNQLTAQESGEAGATLSLFSADYEELSREGLQEERRTILELRNQRVINDNVLRRIQRDLDLAEARLGRPDGDFPI